MVDDSCVQVLERGSVCKCYLQLRKALAKDSLTPYPLYPPGQGSTTRAIKTSAEAPAARRAHCEERR